MHIPVIPVVGPLLSSTQDWSQLNPSNERRLPKIFRYVWHDLGAREIVAGLSDRIALRLLLIPRDDTPSAEAPENNPSVGL
jgi:hypothetical protein